MRPVFRGFFSFLLLLGALFFSPSCLAVPLTFTISVFNNTATGQTYSWAVAYFYDFAGPYCGGSGYVGSSVGTAVVDGCQKASQTWTFDPGEINGNDCGGELAGDSHPIFYVNGVECDGSNVDTPDAIFYLNSSGTGTTPPASVPVSSTVVNNSSSPQTAYAYDDQPPPGMSQSDFDNLPANPSLQTVVLNPGASYTFNDSLLNSPCEPASNYHLISGVQGNGNQLSASTSPNTSPGQSTGNGSAPYDNISWTNSIASDITNFSNVYTDSQTYYSSPATFLQTNGVVDWSSVGGTNASVTAVNEAGFNSLGKQLNAIAADLTAAGGVPVYLANSNAVSGSGGTNIFNGASNVWVMNWPSNYLGLGSGTNLFYGQTNGLTVGELSNVVMNWSNLLAEIATNTFPSTNGAVLTNLSYGNLSYSNWSDAYAASSAAQIGIQPLSDFGNGLTPPSDVDGADYSDTPILVSTPLGNFNFTFSLADSNWSPVYSFMHRLIGWILTVVYVGTMGSLIMPCFRYVMNVPGLKINDLGLTLFGTGGNFAGFSLAGAMCLLLIVMYGFLVTSIMTLATHAVSFSTVLALLNSNPLSTSGLSGGTAGVAKGLALLGTCFPVQLFFSYTFGVLTFKYTSGVVVEYFMGAMRLLPS